MNFSAIHLNLLLLNIVHTVLRTRPDEYFENNISFRKSIIEIIFYINVFVIKYYTVQYHNQSKEYEKSLKYLNMGFTGMFSVETVLKIIGFGVKVGTLHEQQNVNQTMRTIKPKLPQSVKTKISIINSSKNKTAWPANPQKEKNPYQKKINSQKTTLNRERRKINLFLLLPHFGIYFIEQWNYLLSNLYLLIKKASC